jgi:hypothetical protein
MAIFSKKVTAPAVNVSEVQAAAGSSQIGQFLTYSVGGFEERAQSIPTVNRAVDLMASMIGCLNLQQYTLQWTGEEYELMVSLSMPVPAMMRKKAEKATIDMALAQLKTSLED